MKCYRSIHLPSVPQPRHLHDWLCCLSEISSVTLSDADAIGSNWCGCEYHQLVKKEGRPIAKQRFWLAYIPGRFRLRHKRKLDKRTLEESHGQMVMAKERTVTFGPFWQINLVLD